MLSALIGWRNPKCLIDSADQQGGGKRLVQIGDAACMGCFNFERFIVDGSDENDRELNARVVQLASQLDARHAPKINIEHNASEVARAIPAKKSFGRPKPLGREPMRVEQALDAPPHTRIVFHDSHCAWVTFQFVPFFRRRGTCAFGYPILRPMKDFAYCPMGKRHSFACAVAVSPNQRVPISRR
jgi:hypothetical protein